MATKEDLDFAYFRTIGNNVIKLIMDGDMDVCEKIPVTDLGESISLFGDLTNVLCNHTKTQSDSGRVANAIIGKMQHHIAHEFSLYEVTLSAIARGRTPKLDAHILLLVLVHDLNSCLRYIREYLDGQQPNTIHLHDTKRYVSKFIAIPNKDTVVFRRVLQDFEIPYEKKRLADVIGRTGSEIHKELLSELESGEYKNYIVE